MFLTWRLYGSLPAHRSFSKETLTSGQAFVAMDRLLDAALTGPRYLTGSIAGMVVESIHHHEDVLGRYKLHAFVVMSNHVHLLVTPLVPIPTITRTLKTYTARRANEMLGLAGPFWQEETFDRNVRNQQEFDRILAYIEHNPVKAGLATVPEGFLWSSARARLSALD